MRHIPISAVEDAASAIYAAASHIGWRAQKPHWAVLNTVAMIEETRKIGGIVSIERRFFISSLPADAKKIARAVRAHWSVENALHWTLDAVFNEDQSRVRKGNAPHNMAMVRHFALNMLNNAKKRFKDLLRCTVQAIGSPESKIVLHWEY